MGLRITTLQAILNYWMRVPVITSPLTAGFGWGVPLSYQITATNSPTSFGASNLPVWLSVDSGTGLISGTAPANVNDGISTVTSLFNIKTEGYHESGDSLSADDWYRVEVDLRATTYTAGSGNWHLTVGAGPGSQLFTGLGTGPVSSVSVYERAAPFTFPPLPATVLTVIFYARGSDMWQVEVAYPPGVTNSYASFRYAAYKVAVAQQESINVGISATNAVGTDTKTLTLTSPAPP